MSDPSRTSDTLTSPFVLEYAYKRSLGRVIGHFFTELRAGRLQGIRTPSGRVLFPPQEYDPETGESAGEFVEVGPAGEVTTWAWVEQPRPNHPLERPFAWALIRLDGADTALLHAVDAGSAERMATGLRVTVRWREERRGDMHDIACFVPEESR